MHDICFGPDRKPGLYIGIMPAHRQDTHQSGFPCISRSEQIDATTISGLEFGADSAVYPDDPVFCHSEKLVFNEKSMSFRDLVTCARVAQSANKTCVIHSRDIRIAVRKA